MHGIERERETVESMYRVEICVVCRVHKTVESNVFHQLREPREKVFAEDRDRLQRNIVVELLLLQLQQPRLTYQHPVSIWSQRAKCDRVIRPPPHRCWPAGLGAQ